MLFSGNYYNATTSEIIHCFIKALLRVTFVPVWGSGFSFQGVTCAVRGVKNGIEI